MATESKTHALHFLHKKCLTRPKQLLYCETDNEYFTSKETLRGYEYTKGQYVVLDETDLEKVLVKTAHSIDIRGFVALEEIDPIYFGTSHYIEPEELGIKPFFLLRQALVDTNRAGIAKVAFQRREHLCCLRPLDDILVLHTLHYHDEILPHELVQSSPNMTSDELEMAKSLVNSMARNFNPEEYEDKYSLALRQLVEAKIQGKEIKALKVPKAEVIDVMSALRASVEAAMKKASDKKEPVGTGAKE